MKGVLLITLLGIVAMAAGEKPFTCPPLWTLYRGNCYRYFNGGLTWDEAQTQCELYFTERGMASLVSIHDAAENAFVYEMWRSSRGPNPDGQYYGVWLGLKQAVDSGPWAWTDGTATDYTNWYPTEPNNNVEDCAHIYYRGAHTDRHTGKDWNDLRCDRNVSSYVCKMAAPFIRL